MSVGKEREIRIALSALFSLMLLTACSDGKNDEQGGEIMKVTSPAFEHNQPIPSRFTCDGADISPQLIIESIPQEAQSLALIVDDPDAPAGTWVHWVVYNIPVTNVIKEGCVPGKQGINDSRITDYSGPCPPSGTHRYFFKIYALDTMLDVPGNGDKRSLEKAMQGHILDKAELIGLYSRKR